VVFFIQQHYCTVDLPIATLLLVLLSKKRQVLPVEYTTLSALPMPLLEPFSGVLVYLSNVPVSFYCEMTAETVYNTLSLIKGNVCGLYRIILNLG
jgi:hypothetical protein